jgi:hypothetical protein
MLAIIFIGQTQALQILNVTPEMLAALSPYRTSHINLLGQYPLETNRRVKAQNYRL